MTLIPISVVCPQCGSGEVFYSCNPTCCYNHVCNHCYTTFELETTRVGEVAEEFDVQPDVAAIKEIIDRVQGKAPQAVQLGGDPDNPLEVINVIERIVIDATFSRDEDAPAQDAGSLRPAN